MAENSSFDEAGITFPFPEAPRFNEAIEVARGVLWIKLSMPFALDHINVWAIEDDDGYTLVDTGLYTDEACGHWTEISRRYLSSRPVKRVIVTHAHEDHIGTAGWFAQKSGSELWITAEEYEDAHDALARRDRDPSEAYHRFYREAGLTDSVLAETLAMYGRSGRWTHPLPDQYNLLKDGDEMDIGSRGWKVITGSGHSRKHACLYCPEAALLISGDQVLPRISSNVSVRYTDPTGDPLSDWFESIAKMRSAVPENVLVLPAHNTCFFGLHARLNQLRKSHDSALNRLTASLVTPMRVVDSLSVLFRREIKGGSTLRLAVGEAMANLNYLERRGVVQKTMGRDGAHRYVRLDSAISA